MRRTGAGLAGLAILIAALLTGCGQGGSSIKEAVSSFTASHSASASQSAETSTSQAQPSTSQAQPSTAQPSTAQPSTATSQPASATSTAAVTPTAQPTRSQPVVAPAATATAAGSGSGFPWGWFWVIAALVVLAGLAIWGLAAGRRRQASASSDWRMRVIDAYAKGAALHDAMVAAEAPGAVAAADAGLRWLDIQRRADDFGQLLYAMQQAAPGDQERIQVTDVIASLQAARSAMDAERSAGQPDSTLSATVRDRLLLFASSLRSLRGPETPVV